MKDLAVAPERPSLDAAESRRLIERIYDGQVELVGDLYERYFPRLYGFVCSLLGHGADAEDVTHQVFEAMLEALSADELREVASLRRWLFVVARNQAANHRRKHGRVDLTAPAEVRERAAHLLRRDSREQTHGSSLVFDDAALVVAIRRLPRRQRELLLLRYVGDFDLAEIAATIGVSEGSVKEAHRRALNALRDRLVPASTPEAPCRQRPLAMRQLTSSARRALGHSFTSLGGL
jgi:RNA polymerase sigma-70 factor (ECF subfamily)